MHTVTRTTRVHQMPLPSWAADAAAIISDTDRLVVAEGTLGGEPVLVLARVSVVDEATRVEFQVVAVLVDDRLSDQVELRYDDGQMFRLSEVATTEGGDALSTTG